MKNPADKRKKRKIMSLWGTLVLLLAAYLTYVVADYANTDLITQSAIMQVVNDEFTATGLIVRDETVVDSNISSDSYVRYDIADGAKVASGGELAVVFDTQEKLETSLEIERLERIAEKYDEMLGNVGVGVDEALKIEDMLLDDILELSNSVANGQFFTASEMKSDINFTLASYELVTQGDTDILAARESVLAEIDALDSSLGKIQSVVKSQESGFFVSFADGYEDLLAIDMTENLSVDRLEDLIENPPSQPESALGKIVESYDWQYICTATDEQIDGLVEGRTYTLRFYVGENIEVKAALVDIKSEGVDRNILIFESDDVITDLLLVRKETVQIVKGQYEGLRVDTDARRVVGGVVGVYVRSGMTVEFKKIDEIYSGSNFVLADDEYTTSDYLQLFDEIILEGKDLYHGKIVD